MKQFTLLKCTRLNCLDCAGGSPKKVANCADTTCRFHFYRLGKNPNRKGIGSVGNITKNKRCGGNVQSPEIAGEKAHSTHRFSAKSVNKSGSVGREAMQYE